MKVKSWNDDELRVRERESMVEEGDRFTYLGMEVTKDGGATLDIKKRTALVYEASTGSLKSGVQDTSVERQRQRFSRR